MKVLSPKKRFLLILSIFLLFIPLVQADEPIAFADLCSFMDFTLEECTTFGTEFLCNYIIDSTINLVSYDNTTDTCYFLDQTTTDTTTDTTTTTSNATQTTTTTVDTSALEAQIADLNQKVTALETSYTSLSQEVTSLNTNVQSLNQQINNKLNTVSTGLAGLQEDLDSAQENLVDIEETQSTTKFLSYFLLIILILAAGFGVYYYITRNKTPQQSNILNYFSHHLKQGRQPQQIKTNLRQAGWSDSMVDWAHQRATTQPTAKPTANRNKILAIVGITAVVLVVIIYLLTSTTGKAIQYNVDHTIEMVCEPGKILSPGDFGCCTDSNGNAICDVEEDYGAVRPTLEDELPLCIGSKDCAAGRECINKKCGYLSELSSTGCALTCKIVSAEITTSDNEEYEVVIGRGGYTAAGGLDWTLLSSPEFCNKEEAFVPIEITKKTSFRTASGKPEVRYIGKKVITLKKGQTSPVFKHVTIPSLAFTLRVDHINFRCD